MSTIRRARWHAPPPPTPKILNIPRRHRRKTTTKQLPRNNNLHSDTQRSTYRGKLESLFDQERVFSRTSVPIVLLNSFNDSERTQRRERVEETEFKENNEEEESEKWRFQAEILRAECNFLRMERDIALKKLELNRVQTKRTLRSAVETLVSGKEKIHEGKKMSSVLEEEIEELEEKMKELQRSSGVRDFEFGKSSNFDKQANVLQRKLDKLGSSEGLLLNEDEKCVKEIRDMAESSLTIITSRNINQCSEDDQENRFKDVEVLRRKMEKLSKGMLERMEEECGSMIFSCASSATSSASNSRRIEFPHLSSSAQVQVVQQPVLLHKSSSEFESDSDNMVQTPDMENIFREDKMCSGRCKKIVRKIVEQVRAEMEQWSQMQEMLERVRDEMEDLQCSRVFWQDRALDSDDHVQSLHSSVQEWKHKANSSQTKVTHLEKKIKELNLEVGRLKDKKECTRIPRETQNEKEKHVLICRLKENLHSGNKNKDYWGGGNIERRKLHVCSNNSIAQKRSPFQDIGNSSPY